MNSMTVATNAAPARNPSCKAPSSISQERYIREMILSAESMQVSFVRPSELDVRVFEVLAVLFPRSTCPSPPTHREKRQQRTAYVAPRNQMRRMYEEEYSRRDCRKRILIRMCWTSRNEAHLTSVSLGSTYRLEGGTCSGKREASCPVLP